jgi:hypothetical protein
MRQWQVGFSPSAWSNDVAEVGFGADFACSIVSKNLETSFVCLTNRSWAAISSAKPGFSNTCPVCFALFAERNQEDQVVAQLVCKLSVCVLAIVGLLIGVVSIPIVGFILAPAWMRPKEFLGKGRRG